MEEQIGWMLWSSRAAVKASAVCAERRSCLKTRDVEGCSSHGVSTEWCNEEMMERLVVLKSAVKTVLGQLRASVKTGR